MSVFKILVLIVVLTFVAACATKDYVTHYGIFVAENSAGEERQFRVHWQTLRYEGWGENSYRALPVVLEAQCSQRKIYMYDESFGSGRRCANGEDGEISYCGDSSIDMDRRGLDITENTTCFSITDGFGSKDIMSLRGDVFIKVSCRPKETQKRSVEKVLNTDYLLTSAIPYSVSTKYIKGGGGNIDVLIPELFNHSSVCDPDG